MKKKKALKIAKRDLETAREILNKFLVNEQRALPTKKTKEVFLALKGVSRTLMVHSPKKHVMILIHLWEAAGGLFHGAVARNKYGIMSTKPSASYQGQDEALQEVTAAIDAWDHEEGRI